MTGDGLKRRLPESPSEADAVLRRYRPYGAMIVSVTDKTARFLQTSPLDKDEKEDGTFAFSALLYEEGAELSARLLVALWLISVITMRAMEWFDKREERKKEAPVTKVQPLKIVQDGPDLVP